MRFGGVAVSDGAIHRTRSLPRRGSMPHKRITANIDDLMLSTIFFVVGLSCPIFPILFNILSSSSGRFSGHSPTKPAPRTKNSIAIPRFSMSATQSGIARRANLQARRDALCNKRIRKMNHKQFQKHFRRGFTEGFANVSTTDSQKVSRKRIHERIH